MPGRASQLHQTSAILKAGEVAGQADSVRAHIRRIVESPALKGSKRSQEFLQFIVDRALDGHCEELKERTLGVELFGRAPSYDTGADAIVRVTACDVRRRLMQFYAGSSDPSELRIELPPGSYIPEFRCVSGPVPVVEDPPLNAVVVSTAIPAIASPEPEPWRRMPRRLLWAAAILTACTILWLALQRSSAGLLVTAVLPWSAVIQPNGKTHLIFCDPEIVTIQRLLDYTVTLSDYANQHYWPNPQKPEVQNLVQSMSFRGVNVAAVDASTATRISSLVSTGTGIHLDTHPARSLRLADFKTEDNFILFGSPRSNPWVGLYQEQLDFRFEFDAAKKSEFIRNAHPQNGEPSSYVPTAEGWATGQAYAIVALVENPNQSGHVLILAGSNAEATEAAGRFATNLEFVSQTLRAHGIDPRGPKQPFEVLLRVAAMAGSPNTFEVITCHRLQGKAK
jgi:hypothetical protein